MLRAGPCERWLQLPLVGSAVFGVLTTRRSIDWYLDRTVTDPTCLPEEARQYAWRTAHEPGARWAPASFIAGMLGVPGIETTYARLPMPTLMLFGEQPRFSDPAAMKTAVSGATSVEVDRIAGTRDLPHWERPDLTVERIVRFLDEPRPLGASRSALRDGELPGGGDRDTRDPGRRPSPPDRPPPSRPRRSPPGRPCCARRSPRAAASSSWRTASARWQRAPDARAARMPSSTMPARLAWPATAQVDVLADEDLVERRRGDRAVLAHVLVTPVARDADDADRPPAPDRVRRAGIDGPTGPRLGAGRTRSWSGRTNSASRRMPSTLWQ